jgi:hypothetical protein
MAQAYVYEDDATGWRHIQSGDLPAGSGSPLTTKGDLYGFDTDNNRIPVGANNTVLTADSTQALGVKWASAAGGGTVSNITSSGGTITVTSGSGPTANVDLPNSGVTASTYGDSTHVGQFTVSADGIVTGASNVAITGTGGGSNKNVPLLFGAPDASGNAFAGLVATANVRLLVPAFTNGVDGFWWGIMHVPSDYSSSGAFVLRVAANDTTGHVSRWIVNTKAVGTGATWDAALTAETAQNLTMSTTAYRPADVTFTLSTTPVAGSDLEFNIERNGSSGSDTLTVAAYLFDAYFTYS